MVKRSKIIHNCAIIFTHYKTYFYIADNNKHKFISICDLTTRMRMVFLSAFHWHLAHILGSAYFTNSDTQDIQIGYLQNFDEINGFVANKYWNSIVCVNFSGIGKDSLVGITIEDIISSISQICLKNTIRILNIL